MQTSAVAHQRQIRVFVIAWLGITLLMGALTFAGIYYATGLVDNDNKGNGDGNTNVMTAPLADDEPDTLDLSDVDATPPATAESVSAAMAPDAADPAPADSGADAPVPADAGDPAPADDAPAVDDASDAADQPLPPAQDADTSREPDTGQGGMAQDATPVPSPTPLPIQNEEFQVGIQVQGSIDGNPDVYSIWLNDVRDKLKLKWIKQQVRWEDVEPEPGQYDWGMLDITFAKTAEYGVNVMISVLTAPDWAREQGNQRLDEVGPPADPQTYANFLTTLLQRYPGQVHAVEVWNEMNIDREWASIYGLSAERYVEMLSTAYTAIKAVDPGIIVISGALSPTGLNDGVRAYDDFVYMQMLIDAGMLDVADCVGAHHNGYNIGPNVPWDNVPNDPSAQFRGPFDNPHHSWSFYSTLQGYNQRIQAAGSDKKLCITEFGWASSEGLGGYPQGFEFANDVTLAEQAAYFDEAIQLMDNWGFVWLAFVWNLNYGPQAGWEPTNDNVPYSLVRPDFQQAPAYEVIASYNFREK